MSFEEAAAVSVVYITAYFALFNLARLHRVGQAAVQLATYLGLKVYVTVGAEDKR